MAVNYKLAEEKGEVGKQGYWNTFLGLPYEIPGISIEPSNLMKRREDYKDVLPAGVLLLTAGVDIQIDRIEVEVVGWGRGFESWSVARRRRWRDHTVFSLTLEFR